MIRKSLENETEIVWLEDIENLDYVREALVQTVKSRGPVRKIAAGRNVGYANVRRVPGARFYERRLFYLKPYDRDSGDPVYQIGCPSEAIDPRTVQVGVPGRKTPRATNVR